MGQLRQAEPALLVVAAFSRHEAALQWAKQCLEATYGPIALASTPFLFHQTRYYEKTMGTDLHKQFFAFNDLVYPDCLPDVKRHTNRLEEELAASGQYPEERPLNLDPGLLLLGKFLLATTKDKDHRIYLRDGIFAEVTLRYTAGAFEPWPWTYADYRQPEVRTTLKIFRDFYRRQLQASHPTSEAGNE